MRATIVATAGRGFASQNCFRANGSCDQGSGLNVTLAIALVDTRAASTAGGRQPNSSTHTAARRLPTTAATIRIGERVAVYCPRMVYCISFEDKRLDTSGGRPTARTSVSS